MTHTILAIESSTPACSVALRYEGHLFLRYEILPQKHAQRLLEMVDEVLTEAGIKGESIHLLAYGEGPGAFTGIRIAAGVIQGLALGWDKPVVAISSLEAMIQASISAQTTEDARLKCCAMLDARMGEVYLQCGEYTPDLNQWQYDEVRLLLPDQAEEYIVAKKELTLGVGDIQKVMPSLAELFPKWGEVLPSAEGVLLVAESKGAKGAKGAKGDLLINKIPLPVYLRNNIADTTIERARKKALKEAG